MRRLRPSAPKPGVVHQLKPPTGITLSIAEQQMIARRRAVVDLPQVQRDFLELWNEKQPRRKRRAV